MDKRRILEWLGDRSGLLETLGVVALCVLVYLYFRVKLPPIYFEGILPAGHSESGPEYMSPFALSVHAFLFGWFVGAVIAIVWYENEVFGTHSRGKPRFRRKNAP